MSKQDPKHGRWILPLVVLALVLFTYTFVNNLPPAETPTTTTVAAADRTTTTEPPEETTTTTLAPEIIAFAATVDGLTAQADTLQADEESLAEGHLAIGQLSVVTGVSSRLPHSAHEPS